MNWIDLAIISICLWGGVEGYLKGARVMIRKILIICLAILLANVFKGYFVYYFVNAFALDEMLQRAVFASTTVPVSSSSMGMVKEIINDLPLPEIFKEEIWQRLVDNKYGLCKYCPEFLHLAEMVNELVLKTVSFFLALCLWTGWMNLLKDVWGKDNECFSSGRREEAWRWGGAFLGLCRHGLMVSFFIGIASVCLLICPPAARIFDIDGSVLGNLGLTVFNLFNVW
ncbi:MAG: hypothetical protein GX364_05210 [Firmicutes bacterium]|nr:hypothetical protein [Bacillota bacterium]